MSRILKVSGGDYRLQVQSGGNIILDTGLEAGTVTITGNLDVLGTTTTVESVNTTVKDNIIELNYDANNPANGDGISSALGYQSGIEIWRGSRDPAQFLFSEQVSHYDSTTSQNSAGTFIMQTGNPAHGYTLSALQVRTIATDGLADLIFDLQSQPVVLRVANIIEQGAVGDAYASRLTDGNDIPNLQFVKNYVASDWNPGNPGRQGIAAVDNIHFPFTGPILTQIQATTTTLDMKVAGVIRAQVSAAGMYIGNITISQDTITNVQGNANLVLRSNNNHVEISSVLDLDYQPNTAVVSAVSGVTRLYSKANPGPGKSGLFFTNTNAAVPADEIMSRRRAVVLSILL